MKRKLIVNEKYQKLLEENDKDPLFMTDYDIEYASNRVSDISKFKKVLHNIVDLINPIDKEILHEEISGNNFTNLIISGILEIEEDKKNVYN